LRKSEQIGDYGFAPAVLIGAAWMQTIATAPRFQIDQGDRQVVAAQEPFEYPQRMGTPYGVAVPMPRRETRRNRRGRFQRLLVKRVRWLAPITEAL
jgi:hypothetical protein